jgi:hypothetical protein
MCGVAAHEFGRTRLWPGFGVPNAGGWLSRDSLRALGGGADLEKQGKIRIVGAMVKLAGGAVTFLS